MSLVPAGGPLRLNLTAPLGSGVQGALVAHPAAATGCAAGSLAQLHGVLGSGLSTRRGGRWSSLEQRCRGVVHDTH